MQIPNITRGIPFHDGINFTQINFNPIFAHDMTQFMELVLCEVTIRQLCIQLMLTKNFEDFAHVNNMFIFIIPKYEYVIKVHQDKLAKVFVENSIFITL